MKKILILFVILLFLPDNILAYELEQSNGSYRSSNKIPDTGYDFSHAECNGSKIKKEDVVYDKDNQAFSINGITETSRCNFYFKLNGEEITYTHEVNVTVLNGTISGETSKKVNENTTTTFTVNPSEGYGTSEVTCTNGQTASISGNTLTTGNITSDTTCTVKFFEIMPVTETIIAKYSSDNTEGLIKVDQPATDQMKATTEYRYSGSDVKNYVKFNDETWRIIGVFDVDDGTGNYESRVKLMRDESIGDYSWDTSSSDINSGYGINQWGESEDSSGNAYSGADLKTLLNTTYYNRTTSDTCYNGEDNAYISCDFSESGLNETARSMIDDAKWYTAGVNEMPNTPTAYIEERSNALPPTGEVYGEVDNGMFYNDTIVRTKSWIGKVGLLYTSDIGYASKSCYNNGNTLVIDRENLDNSYYASICTNSNWMVDYSSPDTLLLISPLVNRPSAIFYFVQHAGFLGYGHDSEDVRPAVYLKSSVKITGGTGANAENAYELSL